MAIKRLDNRDLTVKSGEIVCVTRFRDEALRLPWCLDYHRKLGVDRFIVVDNNSTDGGTDYVLSQPDVHVFWTDEFYSESRQGMDWINPLLRNHASGHWTLMIDLDEILVYPQCERANLRDLAACLERNGADALACVMLDMYGRDALSDTGYEAGRDFLEAAPYFDNEPIVNGRGGARKRLFWGDEQKAAQPPYLRKLPFVKWRSDLRNNLSAHVIEDVTPSAEMTGALLHFKLFDDIFDKVAEAVASEQYWQNSAQYKRYWARLNKAPGISAFYEKSVRYEDSRQLEDLGFIRGADAFERHLSGAKPE